MPSQTHWRKYNLYMAFSVTLTTVAYKKRNASSSISPFKKFHGTRFVKNQNTTTQSTTIQFQPNESVRQTNIQQKPNRAEWIEKKNNCSALPKYSAKKNYGKVHMYYVQNTLFSLPLFRMCVCVCQCIRLCHFSVVFQYTYMTFYTHSAVVGIAVGSFFRLRLWRHRNMSVFHTER